MEAAAELAFAGVAGQRQALQRGEVTPRELVELSLRRIEQLDPQLHAFRRLFAEWALREAALALGRLRARDERPLLGLPVAIKDNVDVAGDVTTLGTRGFGGAAERDAEVVRRVREASAIVIGRTKVPLLVLGAWTESVGWGITGNPVARRRNAEAAGRTGLRIPLNELQRTASCRDKRYADAAALLQALAI